ncbi:hypothetical protein RhiirA4_487686 [Rhizophagus irregularis]|uniref:Uncharacterized protein n=1 Tax=Rhizophagus irregularis TaxID=588596 RepID=A0A2I1HT36_9GLOM|nr:hypothetical protein RhiirA4_487686 [Rhizophagus irregularis]
MQSTVIQPRHSQILDNYNDANNSSSDNNFQQPPIYNKISLQLCLHGYKIIVIPTFSQQE